MKQIIIFLILSTTLFFVFVCSEDKPVNPPIPKNPGYYYPMQEGYSWRYVELIKPGCHEIHDSFDLKIVGTSRRHGDWGFDRFRPDINDTNFIYEKADTLFLEKVGQSVPLFKILVGPISKGTSWSDEYFNYEIERFENVTLTIDSSVTYKRCARIVKTKDGSLITIYEWWVPGYGEVKEREDSLGTCVRAKELDEFNASSIIP